jgi:hypothetical protein
MKKYNVKYGSRTVTLNHAELNALIEEHERAGTDCPDFEEIAQCSSCRFAVWNVRPGEYAFCSNSKISGKRDIRMGWVACSASEGLAKC